MFVLFKYGGRNRRHVIEKLSMYANTDTYFSLDLKDIRELNLITDSYNVEYMKSIICHVIINSPRIERILILMKDTEHYGSVLKYINNINTHVRFCTIKKPHTIIYVCCRDLDCYDGCDSMDCRMKSSDDILKNLEIDKTVLYISIETERNYLNVTVAGLYFRITQRKVRKYIDIFSKTYPNIESANIRIRPCELKSDIVGNVIFKNVKFLYVDNSCFNMVDTGGDFLVSLFPNVVFASLRGILSNNLQYLKHIPAIESLRLVYDIHTRWYKTMCVDNYKDLLMFKRLVTLSVLLSYDISFILSIKEIEKYIYIFSGIKELDFDVMIKLEYGSSQRINDIEVLGQDHNNRCMFS